MQLCCWSPTSDLAVRAHAAPAVQLQIVDPQSANPGYGRFQLVRDADHVNVCKPPHRKHISYRLTLSLIKSVMRASEPKQSEREAGEGSYQA